MNRSFKILFLLSVSLTSNAQIISTVAGTGTQGYGGDGGQATMALLNNPYGIVFDSLGNLFFCDAGNHVVRKIYPSGQITTVFGTGVSGYSGDGGIAGSAQMKVPIDICISDSGIFFIAEEQNLIIRKVSGAGIISTFAGTGTLGYSGDMGPAFLAQLGTPEGIASDSMENIYVTDYYNHVIRKINKSSGIIATVAGTGVQGYTGDGGLATSAMLSKPAGIAISKNGDVYFSDFSNNVIRKIDLNGIITTIAGTGFPGFSGNSGPAILAQLNGPNGLVIDKYGIIYIADAYNQVIRKIDLNGIILSIAGNGTQGYSGDGGVATMAQLNYPFCIELDTIGNLYIADTDNNVIRKVTNVVGIKPPAASRQQLNIYPNPNKGSFNIEVNGGENLELEIYNTLGQPVMIKQHVINEKASIKIEGLADGVYMIKLIIDGIQNKSQRIIVTK